MLTSLMLKTFLYSAYYLNVKIDFMIFFHYFFLRFRILSHVDTSHKVLELNLQQIMQYRRKGRLERFKKKKLLYITKEKKDLKNIIRKKYLNIKKIFIQI